MGAGLAGLVAATELRRRGVDVLCFEAAARPGGKVHTVHEDGYQLEWGPQSFLWEEDGALARAIASAGLAGEVLEPHPAARKRYVLWKGRLCRVPSEAWRVLGFSGLLRALWEPLVPRRRRGPPESVEAFVRRRFGRDVARRLFDALASGVFAGDPARLEAHTAFARMTELERDFGSVVRAALGGGFRPRPLRGLRGGLGRLPQALAEGLGDALRLETPVTALRRSGVGWEVEAGGRAHAAAAVLVTVPADAAAELVRPLDAELAGLLAGIPYAALASVTLAYEPAAFPEEPEGFGFLVPRGQGDILGCLFPSAVFPGVAPEGRLQLRTMLGGRRDPGAVSQSDEALVARARASVEEVLGAGWAPERAWVVRHPRAIPQYELGHGERVRAIEARAAKLGLWLTGNPYRGVSLGDVARDAEATAEAVAARLGALA